MSNSLTPHETRKALDEMRKNLPMLLEMQVLLAEMERAKYLALRLQGFSESQALKLCRI